MPGPVPKRDEERVRRHAPEVPYETIEAYGKVRVPKLDLPFEPHPMVVDFYEGIKNSAYTKYYEPSDWEMARVACFVLQSILSGARPSSELLKALTTIMSNLLITEGDRRRLRIEVAREEKKQQKDELADVVKMFQERMNGKAM